jgi:DNA-binding PadR family transcriptional regulator
MRHRHIDREPHRRAGREPIADGELQHERGDGRGHHRRGGRSGRLFDHGELRLVVLGLISERPRHGYEIIKEIYPTLTMLEELGHATVAESNGKKRYAITDEGTAYLAANRAGLDHALARMQSINTAHGGGPAPEILRARENLKLALRLREARGPLTEQQVRAIAAALDAAAIAIERS